MDRRPLFRGAVEANGPVVFLEDVAGESESQPGPFPRRLGAEERLEDAGQMARINAAAIIGDRDLDAIRAGAASVDGDVPVFSNGVQGLAEQNDEQGFELVPVNENLVAVGRAQIQNESGVFRKQLRGHETGDRFAGGM